MGLNEVQKERIKKIAKYEVLGLAKLLVVSKEDAELVEVYRVMENDLDKYEEIFIDVLRGTFFKKYYKSMNNLEIKGYNRSRQRLIAEMERLLRVNGDIIFCNRHKQSVHKVCESLFKELMQEFKEEQEQQ